MPRFLVLVALLAAVVPAFAADPPKKGDPTGYEAKFADGSVIQLSLLETTVVVASKYGKLTIPLADVRRIEFGFRFPEGMEAKVNAVADDLGSAEFKARDKASKDILTFGEFALPAVKRAMKSDSPEVSKRAQDAMRKLEETLPKELLELRDYDVLYTADGPIRGTIETAGFKAKTKYFGDTTLKLSDLRDLRPVGMVANEQFNLEAAKHARLRWAAWHDTGVEVTADTTLDIAASGKIDQWPQSPGQYPAGPNGSNGFVTGPDAGGGPGPGGFLGGPGFPGGAQQFKSGAVYGKIGEKGPVFLIGEAFKGKPAERGKLYIIIAPSHWGNENCTGEFAVKLKTGG